MSWRWFLPGGVGGDSGGGVGGGSSTPAASTLAEWDGNKNLSANAFLTLKTSTVTSSTPLVLTMASTQVQELTGSVAQVVELPTTGIVGGFLFVINNQSTAAATIEASDATTIAALPIGAVGVFRSYRDGANDTTHWVGEIKTAGTVLKAFPGYLTLTNNGVETLYPLPSTAAPAASTLAKWDAQKNLSADAFLPGQTTTVASSTPLVLTLDSTQVQIITGTTTPQTVKLATTSINPGYERIIVNQITGANVTVVASDGSTVATLLPNEIGIFKPIFATPTNVLHWVADVRTPGTVNSVESFDQRYEPLEQFAVLQSPYTLTSQTAAQQLLNTTTNGAVTLQPGDYFFECGFTLSGMSATSGSFGFGFGGTATFTQQWESLAGKGASISAISATIGWNTANATNLIGGANTATNGVALIRGTLNATTGGTLIPQVSLTQAAAAVVGAGSYFRIQSVQSTAAYAGNWS